MSKLRTFFALSATLAITVVVACGDKVTVPADKTGKCIAGLLQKCGDTCVDLQSDLANCGACGTACAVGKGEICVNGKCAQACPQGSTRCGDKCVDTNVDRANCGKCGTTCGATEICALGSCAGSCEAAGYLTCQGATTKIDAGADASLPMSCVDPKTDHDNCGGCGNACAAMEACSNGTCCTAPAVGCGGACVSTQSDPNNCGGCGIKCTMAAPNCAAGSCSKCNNKILVLADNQTGVNANMKNALKAAGFDVTMVDNGSATYTGTPAATDFGAVVVVSANNYLNNTDMPAQGQQAIVTAQGGSTGVVFDCFDAFQVTQQNKFQTLKTIELLQYAGAAVNQAGGNANANQQWVVPQSFSPVNSMYWMSASLINNGNTLGTYTPQNYQVGAYRSTPGGRVAHVAYAMNYSGASSMWTNDPNGTAWTISMVRWAAGCSM